MDPLLNNPLGQFAPQVKQQTQQSQAPLLQQPQQTQAIQPQIQANLGYDPEFDYRAAMNQLKTVNPNDPQLQVLQTQRDAKLNALYGNDFQKRINELSAINPNNPDIVDLQRLREAKVKQQQVTQPQETTPSAMPPEGTQVTEYTNDQLINKGMATYEESLQNKEAILKKVAETPFTDNYSQEKQEYFAAMNKPFEYNAETDMALQQAKRRTTNSVMAEMNKRGFLSNSMTQEELINAYGDLESQFRSMAFNEYNKNLENTIQKYTILQDLTEFDYKKYRDWVNDNLQYANEGVDTAYKLLEEMKGVVDYKQKEELNKIEAYNSQVTKQTQRVKMLGYVDNEASIYLGLPVGTLSEEATKQAYELKKYAAQKKIDLENDIDKMDKAHKFTVAEMQEKMNVDKQLKAIDFGYDKQKIAINAASQKSVAAYKSTLNKKADTKTVSNYNNFLKQGIEMYTQTYSKNKDGETVTQKRYTPEAIKNWIVGLKISDNPTENAELRLALINSIIPEKDLDFMKYPEETKRSLDAWINPKE